MMSGHYREDPAGVENIEVGGIIQGDVPTWRTAPMPYGGVKNSGVVREGPAYTYWELTEERLLVLNRTT